jgi:hypothetical protein
MEKKRVIEIRISGNRVSGGGQVAKNNATQHDATEVGRGNEGSNKLDRGRRPGPTEKYGKTALVKSALVETALVGGDKLPKIMPPNMTPQK